MFNKITCLLVILVCLALVIPSLSCFPGSSLELKLDKAPRLNEPVTLTCIRLTETRDAGKHEKITLEFERVDPKTYSVIKVPAQDMLIGGNLNWEGDMAGEPLEFSATLKFHYEGNWGIYARSTERPQDGYAIFLNVTEDSGPFGWPEDYRPRTSPSPDNSTERSPITVELDIPKPPRLNEPVQLTWSLNSIRDVDGVIAKIEFWHLEGTKGTNVPVEDMLIEGNLTWNGSLKKDSPLNFSATIKFPLEGDWDIRAHGDSYIEQQPINSTYPLFLHIDKDKSRWGWTEPHEIKTHGPPPPVDEP